jgi:hypothetical protein
MANVENRNHRETTSLTTKRSGGSISLFRLGLHVQGRVENFQGGRRRAVEGGSGLRVPLLDTWLPGAMRIKEERKWHGAQPCLVLCLLALRWWPWPCNCLYACEFKQPARSSRVIGRRTPCWATRHLGVMFRSSYLEKEKRDDNFRLLLPFINKITRSKPIQSDEMALLWSRSKIKERKT